MSVTETPAPAATNPYPGLRPFREDEEHLFFGRDHQIDGMVDALARTHFLVVVGTSGSGKSSLVNCGLRPALHRGLMASAGTHWRVAQFRPGNRPLHALAEALVPLAGPASAAPGPFSPADLVEATLRSSRLGLLDAIEQAGIAAQTNVLVVADQFEELFRYRDLAHTAARGDAGANEDATAFVNLLLEVPRQAVPNVFVVLTMRSDFLGDCAQFFGLPEAINAGQYLVPRLSRDERRIAIAGPAGVSGAVVSPVLLTRLVNDVGDNPDQLSILQHALNRTWARWHAAGTPRAPIELAQYEEIGAMSNALDEHAEEAFAEVGAPRQALCERIFKALTDRSTDARGVRRPTRFKDLCAIVAAGEAGTEATVSAEVAAVLEVFRQPGRGFVMPPAGEALTDDSVVDISHESLMRVWQRLARWAAEESQSVHTYRRLAGDAELYAKGNESLLWDPALQVALDWRNTQNPNAAWAARYHAGFEQAMRYLEESRVQRDRHRAMARARTRRRRVVAVATVVTAVVVALLMWRLAGVRESERSVALSSRLAAQAQADGAAGRIDRALLTAVAALRTAPTQDAQDALLALLQGAPRRMLQGHTKDVAALAFSPDGTRLASASPDGTVLLWDAAAGRQVRALSTGALGTPSLAFVRDGSQLTAGSWVENGGLRWNLADDAAPAAAQAAAPPVLAAALHAERGLFAGVRENDRGDSFITLWDVDRRVERVSLPAQPTQVSHLVFSPDGLTLASTSAEGSVQLWDIAADPSRSRMRSAVQAHSGPIARIVFSRDGQLIATLGRDGKVIVLPQDSRQAPRTLTALGESNAAESLPLIAFSTDGHLLAIAGGGQGTALWDVASGQRRHLLRGTQGDVRSIVFGPDGRLATAGADGLVLLWRAVADQSMAGAEPSAPERWVSTTLKGHTGPVVSLAFSADGRQLASGGADRIVVLWDVAPDRPLHGELRRGLESMTAIAYSPDGKMLAFASEDSSVTLWRPADGAGVFRELRGLQTDALTGLAFSPDGRLLAATAWDGTIAFWDTERAQAHGEMLRTADGTVTSVAFRPPDGRWLASASVDGKVALWEVSSGRRAQTLEHLNGIRSVAFSPDGSVLAAAGQDGRITLWKVGADALAERLDPVLEGHTHQVTSVAFSADGRLLVSGALDKTVRLWDPVQRRALGAPLAQPGSVLGLALSRDGRVLAAGLARGGVVLWDLQTRVALAHPLTGHDANVNSVAFAPDGHTLASASADLTVRLWDSDAAHWQQRACAIANRNMAPGEWPKDLQRSELPKALAVLMTDTPLCSQFPLRAD